MNIEEYLQKMRTIQDALLELIEKENDKETAYHDFIEILNNLKIQDNCNELKSFLHLILKISKNYHQTNLFNYIEKILSFFGNDIKKYFSNSEIFTIFKGNKKILLYLIKEKILNFDKYISSEIIKSGKNDYVFYFFPEIKEFLQENEIDEIEEQISSKDFENKRQIGENDSYICKLVRDDSIDEFIKYKNQVNLPLSVSIKNSFFETNSFLLKNENTTLIEYAAFVGSIRIFKYLCANDVELKPSLWLYAIHSKNAEIIEILEENHVQPTDSSYMQCYIESIKCHHNDIANYIKNNHLENEEENSQNILVQSLKNYNFTFIQKNLINESSFYNLCKYDYYPLVEFLLKEKSINLNLKTFNETRKIQ